MRSVEEQLQAAITQARPLSPIEVSLRESRGCVLATDLTAQYPIPSFDAAEIDGYAVVASAIADASASAPTRLDLVDSVSQGFASDASVTPETAVWVAAGALMPPGADAVVPSSGAVVVQDERGDGAGSDSANDSAGGNPPSATGRARVAVSVVVVADEGIVRVGSHRPAGAPLLPAGTRLGDRALAAVAAGGYGRVPIHPEPRVVVVTVGDELVDTTRALTTGLVHDVVSVMLGAAGDQAGASTFRGGPSRRDPRSLGHTIQDQLVRADLVVVVGEDDGDQDPQDGLVARALRDAGCDDLQYCRIDPGPAIGLGTVGDDQIAVVTIGRATLAAFVGFEVIARPVIAALAGRESLFRPVVRAQLTESVVGAEGIRNFIPAVVRLDTAGQRALVTPLHEPLAEAALWLHRANALIIVPEEVAGRNDGDEVAVIRLDRE